MRQYAGYMSGLLWIMICLRPAAALGRKASAPGEGQKIFYAAAGTDTAGIWALGLVLLASLAVNLYFFIKTRRLKAETASHRQDLEKSVLRQKFLTEAMDHLNDYVFSHDLEGNFYEFNASVQKDSDYTKSELGEMNIRDLVPERFKAEVDDYLESIRKNGSDNGYMRIVNKAGEEMILEYTCSLIRGYENTPMGVHGIARNITQQIKTRKALEKSEKRYRNILETIEDGYYEVDLGGHYRCLNKAALQMLGYSWEEIAGESYKKIIAEEDHQQVFETFNYVYRTKTPVKTFHWRSVRSDGSICHQETSVSLMFDDKGNPAGFQGIMRDITERTNARKRQKELEEQLQQAQKMESVGTLAGGIAHDFNNILFPIIGYTELAMQDLSEESQAYQNLEKVMKSSERAKSLVQQILNFSRQSSNEPEEPVYIQPVIKETIKLLKNTIPASIEIKSDIREYTGKAMVNLARIHQVIMNLCTNAYQAMENTEKGLLEVKLKQTEITGETSPGYRNLTPGQYLCVTVSDTGCGIPPEIKEKIFEPYFSTKEQEKGTGLGLSVSYGIIKQAGGKIMVESMPGKGSTFSVLLPVAKEEAGLIRPGARQGAMPTGTGCILVVDDEQQLVELEKRMLESLGYEVITHTSAVEAEEAFRNRPGRYDMLITDLTMPNKNGTELIKALREIRPDLPVILCTGYSETVSRQKAEALGVGAVLLKPINKNDLAVLVSNALEKTRKQDTTEPEQKNHVQN
ncbi:MAG: PAS domain S-box protein [Desulfobacterales bacterium]